MTVAINYENQRFCAVPDHVGAASICKWGATHITWVWGRGNYSGLPEEQIHEAFERAVQSWCKPRTGLTASYTQNVKTANVVITFGRKNPLGSKLGVLAHCELPCNPNQRQVRMVIDEVEAWTISLNPPPDKVDLERVFKHEFGHGIGIEHISDGNLMAPTYSSRIPDLMQGDRVAALARYPVPPGEPEPPPPPPPTGNEWKEIAAIGARGNKIYVRAMGQEILVPIGMSASNIEQLVLQMQGVDQLPPEIQAQAVQQAIEQQQQPQQ